MLCLLKFSSPGNSVRLPVVGGPHWIGLAHLRGVVWDPGIVCIPRLRLCCDCLCLIAVYRDVLLSICSQTYLSGLFLKDIGGWRISDWELGSLGRVHASCYAALSFCLYVKQIKGRGMVVMPCWVVNVLFLQGVSVPGTPVGVVAPVGAAILVIGLSDLVGGSMGHSEWLSLMSRWVWLWYHRISVRGIAIVCPSVFGIGYKGRTIAGSSSLDTTPVTGSLLFNAPVCRLAAYCAAGFSSCVLFSGCDCIRLAVFQLFLRRVSGDFVMATDSDAPAGPGLASPLVSHWKFHGTLRRLMYTFIRKVWLIWTQFRTSWASLVGSRKRLWSGFYKGGMHRVYAHLFRIRGSWKEDFTTLPSWIYRTRQSRRCQRTTSPCFGSSGQ